MFQPGIKGRKPNQKLVVNKLQDLENPGNKECKINPVKSTPKPTLLFFCSFAV